MLIIKEWQRLRMIRHVKAPFRVKPPTVAHLPVITGNQRQRRRIRSIIPRRRTVVTVMCPQLFAFTLYCTHQAAELLLKLACERMSGRGSEPRRIALVLLERDFQRSPNVSSYPPKQLAVGQADVTKRFAKLWAVEGDVKETSTSALPHRQQYGKCR